MFRIQPTNAVAVWIFVAIVLAAASARVTAAPPDVVFLVVDDMNDWTTLFDAQAPIQTPNLQRLAARGVFFAKAYCVSPACNPSRAATLTGLRPGTTGAYGNKSDWRKAVPDRKTIMQRFMDAGYHVRGAGKIFHHHYDGAFHDAESFHDFQHMRPQLYPESKLNGAPEYGSPNTDWGEWPHDPADSIDVRTADYAVAAINGAAADTGADRRPLFLACGIFKPHSPFFSPEEFHRPYKAIPLPTRKEDDWNDLPAGAQKLYAGKQWFWKGMTTLNDKRPGSYHDFVRSYAAAATFADAQIGRVLDALEKSPRRDNTIVVLWSDHGFHLGEKDHIEKFMLWEKSNHIPFIVVAPGVTVPGGRCDHPVDMSCLYPTLLELAGLPADPKCDGTSIVDQLRDPARATNQPALMSYMRGNHAVRSDRWRYIRYADGTEELYDHAMDPHEWSNLADDPQYATIIADHAHWIPEGDAEPVTDMRRPKANRPR